MKILINSFILLSLTILITSFSSVANASGNNINKIRVVNVDSGNYQNEYESAQAGDPLHGFNYAMFKFNNALDQYFLEPVARGYRFAVPQWGRDRVTGVFNNLEEPVNIVNSLLQGDVEGIFRSFWRFVINSTFGVAGIYDVAADFGLPEKDKGFSQTLALYGVGSGPYLVVPFMGPSTPRDFLGTAADMAANPKTYFEEPSTYIATGVDVVQTREGLLNITDDLKKNSFDLYSSYKSSYLQHRKKKVLETLE